MPNLETSMIPMPINPLPLILGALIVSGAGFAVGWTTNGWRLSSELSQQRAEVAEDAAKRSEKALADLTEASKRINESANAARVDVAAIAGQLAAIRKDRKNEQKPLPIDCKPDDVRVRSLEAAAAAVDAAIGSKPSR